MLRKTYEEILLYKMEANKNFLKKINITTLKRNKRYMQGLSLTTIAILIANTLLLVSIFIAIEKTPTRVKVVNIATKKINKLYLVPLNIPPLYN